MKTTFRTLSNTMQDNPVAHAIVAKKLCKMDIKAVYKAACHAVAKRQSRTLFEFKRNKNKKVLA